MVWLQLGQRDKARQCFERALWINPRFQSAEANLRQAGA
jgi:Tfp pilus assembly protein PilF